MWAGLAPHQATHKDLATPYPQGWGCGCGMILVTQCASTWEKECTCILRGFFEGAHVGREFSLQKLTLAVSISTSAGTNKTWCLMQTKYKVLTVMLWYQGLSCLWYVNQFPWAAYHQFLPLELYTSTTQIIPTQHVCLHQLTESRYPTIWIVVKKDQFKKVELFYGHDCKNIVGLYS